MDGGDKIETIDIDAGLQEIVDEFADLEATLARCVRRMGRQLVEIDGLTRAAHVQIGPQVQACALAEADGVMADAIGSAAKALAGLKGAHCLYLAYATEVGQSVPSPRSGGR